MIFLDHAVLFRAVLGHFLEGCNPELSWGGIRRCCRSSFKVSPRRPNQAKAGMSSKMSAMSGSKPNAIATRLTSAASPAHQTSCPNLNVIARKEMISTAALATGMAIKSKSPS